MNKDKACACDTCKNMCKIQPCIGTPKDIAKLVLAGYGDKMAKTTWMVGVLTGTTAVPTDMYQIMANDDNSCPFLDENDLCKLHDVDLKPTEGRLSHHDDAETFSGDFRDTINYKVAMSWIDEDGDNRAMNSLVRAMGNLMRERDEKNI
jgi:hypothetical protein